MCLLSVWRLIFFLSIIRFWSSAWFDSIWNGGWTPFASFRERPFILQIPMHSFLRMPVIMDGELILSRWDYPLWLLVGRPIPAPYQYSGNDGHLFCTEESHKIHNHSFVMISTDNTAVVSYINKQGGTHSPNLCVEVWEILHWCLEHDIVIRVCHIPDKFSILQTVFRDWTDLSKQNGLEQSVANSIFQILNYPNVDLFATRFSHKLPLYVSPVPDNHASAIDALSMNWNFLHAYAFLPTILIPSVLAKICQSQCRIVLIAPLWPQCLWFSEVLQLLVSAPICLPLFPKQLTQSKGKFQHPNLQLLTLHAWELSSNQLEIKSSRKPLQILSQNQDEHLLRKSLIQNGLYTPIGVTDRRLIQSRLLLQL